MGTQRFLIILAVILALVVAPAEAHHGKGRHARTTPVATAPVGPSGGVTTFSAVVIIPLNFVRPDGVAVTADSESVAWAQQQAADVDVLISRYSNGYGDLAVRTLIWDGTVTANMYQSYGADGFYVSPAHVKAATGVTEQITMVVTDLDAVKNPPGAVTINNAIWAAAWSPYSSNYLIHEIGHWIEFRTQARGIAYGQDTCGEFALIHCGAELGYGDDLGSSFFAGFYSGTLAGGAGFTPQVWYLIRS